MKVAIQGAEGSFHHLVAKKWFGPDTAIVPCNSFADVFAAVDQDRATHAVTAIENSLYGSINEVYDLLLAHGYQIVGEVPEHIHQQLIGFAGTDISSISRVYSHPVALNQCRDFLDMHLPNAERIEHHDTAASVELIKFQNDLAAAAIASHSAATLHNMSILKENIEDEALNFTRFLILDPHGKPVKNADKASLVLRTDHSPGALHRALGILANVGSNLTKLQSRPIRGEVFKYQFFLDTETDAETLGAVIPQLTRSGCEVTILGHYKAAQEIEVD